MGVMILLIWILTMFFSDRVIISLKIEFVLDKKRLILRLALDCLDC